MRDVPKKLGMPLLLTCLLIFSGAMAASAQTTPIAQIEVHPNGVVWHQISENDGVVLSVSGPCGVITSKWKAGEKIILEAVDAEGRPLDDGTYTWQLDARPIVDPEITEILLRARIENDEETIIQLKRDGKLPVGQIQNGYLTVEKGEFVVEGEPEKIVAEKPTTVDGAVSANKDFVINDDLIVDGSACIGFDCVNGESFSFDTIRLKENNLRIKFEDTSSTASFPTTDWQLTANASANGGASKFSIDDISGGRTPFTVEANAPSHSLYVDDGGRIGNGTSTPVAELHLVNGDSPTVRLEQNGSSGFAPQTWDVAGNETNFFIRDASNGSTLPFRIRPGAPSSSIFIDVDGDVAIGNASPDEKLHVDGGNATIEGPAVKLNLLDSDNSVNWFFQSDTGSSAMLISKSGSGGEELRINERNDSGGLATFVVSGSVQATNVVFASSRDKKADFESVDPQDVLTRLSGLDIQTWRYKTEDESIRHMGPIAEDFAAAFGLGNSDTNLTVTDVNGVALAAIQALQQEISALKAEIEELKKQ